MAGTQAPGFYRFMIGKFEVTVLSDGTYNVPVDTLLSIKSDQVRASLKTAYRDPSYEMSFNSYLINTGDKLILIDAGGGRLLGPTLGRLTENLQASGYTPEQIDEIYVTHMHEDHVGGLTIDGRTVFPNAVVRAAAPEAAFWFAKDGAAHARPDTRRFFPPAVASLKPYVDAGRFKTFETGTTLHSGISTQPTYGHTAGHTVYVVQDGGQKLELWGDLIHAAELQLPDPSITIQFDTDPTVAAQQRTRRLADAAKEGYIVGAAHISFPGVGRFVKTGRGYSWSPLPYTTVVKARE
jgi:glyoxylase-like metal-dependent hydrolase (beta-lactamase superfamily II)